MESSDKTKPQTVKQVVQLNPPEKFVSHSHGLEQADAWAKWIKRFERYSIASGLKEKSNVEQVSTLLYAMGESADDILATLRVEETKANYEEMKSALDNYFGARRNVIVERARFNRRIQRPGESIDSFIQDLYRLADECNYDSLKDDLIRDRIVVGVLDERLSERLQLKADLTLKQAVEISRLHETRKESRDVARGDINSTVEFVKKPENPRKSKKQQSKPKGGPQGGKKCQWCGREAHERSKCPARNSVCHNCKKKGHFKDSCLKKSSNKQNVDELDIDIPFLGEIGSNAEYWKANVSVNDNSTSFKLDTGASVTVISDKEHWLQKQKLDKPCQFLRGPGGTKMPVKGTFRAILRSRDKNIEETVYVMENQPHSLLSRDACVKLGLIMRAEESVDEVKPSPDFRSEFPNLFKGLGKMKTEYHISLEPDANPVCLFTPRKVPHPLLPKVKEELDRMVQQGVISPVTEPTSWCSGMVPVLKQNGSVRVCVDLVQPNQSVKREVHPMFSVDESLAKLGQSKIFSKLDANSGFWQMPLDQESRLLTTFITPYGRFCFNRVPFGICSAPEVYQRAISNILEGIDGVICHVDDVLVHETTQAEHDARLRAVLERLQKAGVTLNNKCEFSKQSMKFLGHIIDETGIYPDPEKTEAVRNFPRPEKVKDLQRFMGLVNQMGKFIPDRASHNERLRQLLKKENVWHWGQAQEQSFQRIKEELAAPRSLAYYNPKRPTILSTDASNLGLGAVLSTPG